MSNESTRATERLTELRRLAYKRRSAFDRMLEDETALSHELSLAMSDLSLRGLATVEIAEDGTARVKGKPAPEYDSRTRRAHRARARLRDFREERQSIGETAARFNEAVTACEQHLRRRGIKVEPGRPW